MRVRILASLPPVKAWFPLPLESAQTISSFKAVLCTSLPTFRALSPTSLHLSIDGFELLDTSELSILRDGDLICVDVLDVKASTHVKHSEQETSHKRKRRMSSPSSSSSGSESESDSESDSDSETSNSESDSNDSTRLTTPSLRKAEPLQKAVQPRPHPSTYVPPGYGKPQTRSRNLRRRLKRAHERESAGVSDGRASGANAVVPGNNGDILEANGDAQMMLALPSLSLRNKNKAKNFRSLMNRPLPPKIVFGDQEGTIVTPEPRVLPRLIPPSSRSSLPPNMFVTSIDVEAGLQRSQRRTRRSDRTRIEHGDELEEKTADLSVDVDQLESIAREQWATLAKLTKMAAKPGMIVGYKGLGINPVTYTPEEMLTVVGVVSCEDETVVVRPLRGVSFSGPVDDAEEERYTWVDVEDADWRIVH